MIVELIGKTGEEFILRKFLFSGFVRNGAKRCFGDEGDLGGILNGL